jgi:WD40 repeat protein
VGSTEAVLLQESPTDGVTAVQFLPRSFLLAATSWDGSLRIYSTTPSQRLEKSHFMQAGPCLSLATTHDTVYVGSLDGSIRAVTLDDSPTRLIGTHTSTTQNQAACSCLVALDHRNEADTAKSTVYLVSAGWHRQLHIWDEKQATPVVTLDLPGKAFAMDVTKLYTPVASTSITATSDPPSQYVIVACSGRRLVLVDVTVPSQASILADWESTLKYQIRCLSFFNDSQAVAIGSVEGRVAVETVPYGSAKPPPVAATDTKHPAIKQYTFKCHRVGDLVYPVNAIAFHPHFGTFATGGCDGTVGK